MCILFLSCNPFFNKVLSDNICNTVSLPHRSSLKTYLRHFCDLSLQFKLTEPVLCMCAYTAESAKNSDSYASMLDKQNQHTSFLILIFISTYKYNK